MQYTQRKLQRSVTEIRRSRSGRPSVSVAVIASILAHGGSAAEPGGRARPERGSPHGGPGGAPGPLRRSPAGCWRVILDHASSVRVRLAGMTDRYRIRAFEALSVHEFVAV